MAALPIPYQVGDARKLPLEDSSIDAIVTDPPYELNFMGRSWDRSGVAFGTDAWTELLRVAKPGTHLLAFGGTRTFHRIACAIEDAGWEIRDSIGVLGWVYAQGFPKSLDVSKAIDRAATEDATRWQGWGTALKPAWEPIIVARKPLSGTVARNVLDHGTGALNVDGCRVGWATETERAEVNGRVAPNARWREQKGGGATEAMSRLGERHVADVTHAAGRWPTNLLIVHHPDCAETCVPGCHAAELDRQSGQQRSGVAVQRNGGGQRIFGQGPGLTRPDVGFGDSGGASRFYPQFRFNPKAPSKERPSIERDGKRIMHPTVKPVSLMRWLVRLVTPPDGIVLDPFCGTGTTLEAAEAEGFKAIGYDSDPDAILLTGRRLGVW